VAPRGAPQCGAYEAGHDALERDARRQYVVPPHAHELGEHLIGRGHRQAAFPPDCRQQPGGVFVPGQHRRPRRDAVPGAGIRGEAVPLLVELS
jgi:hypothetical protein